MPKLSDEEIVKRASLILERKAKYEATFSSPSAVRTFLQTKLYNLEREVFSVMFLDTKHKLISYEELFKGTLDSAHIYPREVAKSALLHNCGSVILAHNHPSGDSTPSGADKRITEKLVECLGLFDINILDHIIIGKGETTSFAEHGLL